MKRLSDHQSQHPSAISVIENMLRSGRRHHAYILASLDASVSEAVTTSLGQSLVCTRRGASLDACGQCPNCKAYERGTHVDTLSLRPNDKGIIAIDAVRGFTARLALRASDGGIKVARVFEADRMNRAAQNALLKTLEEPAGEACFLLTVTRARALLPTVRSRCQRIQLASSPPSSSATALCEFGIPQPLASRLAWVVGSDVERASELLEAGAEEISRHIDAVLQHPDDMIQLMKVARELGSEKEKTELALAFLEVHVRDALARSHGVSPAVSGTDVPEFSLDVLKAAVDRLQDFRRVQMRSPNRTLALENLFLTLASHP
ncbi:MAG: hypothetical protein AAFP04_05020 [Myxococcota bacterium]